MKEIVILGAGFGGLQLALELDKKFRSDKNVNITLIDKHDYHLFVSNLYEAATTEEEIVSVEQVKRSISVPISEVLKGKRIKFIKAEVNLIDVAKKEVTLASKKITFDYLVIAFGSQSDFFNIEGAAQNTMTLKSLPDALRIRNQIAFAIESHRMDVNKKNIRLVVAGGGYTGLELAGELKGLADFLAWENEYPREKIEIEVIEAANKLVAGFDDRLSQDALERLQDLQIHVRLSSKIIKVDRNFIELLTGDKISYDIIFWTTGVKASNFKLSSEVKLDAKGRLPVNGYFQVEGHDNIFALGDIACVMGVNGRPVPGTAQDAIEQAKSLAKSLPYLMKNQKPPEPYKNTQHGFIVSLGGKWAIMDYGGFYIKGYPAYVVHKLAHLRYYLSIVGFWKAISWVLFETRMYEKND
jgi:NADH dehydrogenase